MSATMTKRKSEEEKAVGKARKRVPFNVPKDAATSAMYEAASRHRLQPLLVLTFQMTVMRETRHARPCYDYRSRFATKYGQEC